MPARPTRLRDETKALVMLEKRRLWEASRGVYQLLVSFCWKSIGRSPAMDHREPTRKICDFLIDIVLTAR